MSQYERVDTGELINIFPDKTSTSIYKNMDYTQPIRKILRKNKVPVRLVRKYGITPEQIQSDIKQVKDDINIYEDYAEFQKMVKEKKQKKKPLTKEEKKEKMKLYQKQYRARKKAEQKAKQEEVMFNITYKFTYTDLFHNTTEDRYHTIKTQRKANKLFLNDKKTKSGYVKWAEKIAKDQWGERLQKAIASEVDSFYGLIWVEIGDVKYIGLDKIEYRIIDKDINFKRLKLRGCSLQWKVLGDVEHVNTTTSNKCAIEYLHYISNTHPRMKRHTEQELMNIFPNWEQGISTEEIQVWANEQNFVVHALNPLMRDFSYEDNRLANNVRGVLYFAINGNHLHPILDKHQQAQISNSNTHTMEFEKVRDVVKWNAETAILTTIDEVESKDFVVEECKTYYIDFKPFESEDLSRLASKFMKQTRNISLLKCSQGRITAFKHPTANSVFVVARQFKQRMEVANKLYEFMPIDEFMFQNQSFAVLADSWYKYRYNSRIPSSTYTDLFDIYPIMPWIKDYVNEIPRGAKSYDITKSYTSCMLLNTFDIPIYTPFDVVEEMDWNNLTVIGNRHVLPAGEYYINRMWRYGTQECANGFYPYHWVMDAMDEGFIDCDDITFQKVARVRKLPADVFKEYIQDMYEMFGGVEGKIFKQLMNQFWGLFGTKWNKEEYCCVCDNFETTCALYNEETFRNMDCTFEEINNAWFVRSQKITRKHTDRLSIHRHIIALGRMRLYKLEKELIQSGCTILCENTDSVGFMPPKNWTSPPLGTGFGDYREEAYAKLRNNNNKVEPLQEYELPEDNNKQWNTREIQQKELLEILINDVSRCVIRGGAGCLKTDTLCKLILSLIQKDTKAVVLSSTHKALHICRQRDVPAEITKTLSSFFFDSYNKGGWEEEIKNLDIIIVEEASMTCADFMIKLWRCTQTNPDLKLYFVGDFSQCDPIEEDGAVIPYLETEFFKKMCDFNDFVLPYIEETARFDRKLQDVVTEFLTTGIAPEFRGEGLPPYKHDNPQRFICKLNDTKNRVNKEISMKFKERSCGDATTPQGFTHGAFYYYEGQMLVCRENVGKLKKENVFNSCQVTLIDWKENGDRHDLQLEIPSDPPEVVFVKNVRLKKTLHENEIYDFEAGHCITIQRIQGDKITEPFEILDGHKMTRKELYVAMTRSTKYEYVSLPKSKNFYEKAKGVLKPKLLKPIPHGKDSEFGRGVIYGCFHKDKLIYIGSSTDYIARINKHWQDSIPSDGVKFHNYLENVDRNEITWDVLQDAPSKSFQELERKETKLIHEYLDKGTDLLNEKLYGYVPQYTKQKTEKMEAREKMKNEKYKINDNKEVKKLRMSVNGQRISKGYSLCGLEEAMKYMRQKRDELLRN